MPEADIRVQTVGQTALLLRHCQLARGCCSCRSARDARAQSGRRLLQRRRDVQDLRRQPVEDRDSASGQPEGPDRRGEPLAAQASRRQPAQQRLDQRFQFRNRPGHANRRGRLATSGSSIRVAGGTTLGAAGKLFGLDLIGALDLAENDGLVTTLAEPNLTALSGETASFLAGGEFPIPISQSLGCDQRSSTSNMASASPSRRSCLPTAASRCASVRKSASCRTKARSSSTTSPSRR